MVFEGQSMREKAGFGTLGVFVSWQVSAIPGGGVDMLYGTEKVLDSWTEMAQIINGFLTGTKCSRGVP